MVFLFGFPHPNPLPEGFALPTSLSLTPSMEPQRAFLRGRQGEQKAPTLRIMKKRWVFRGSQKALLLSDRNVGKGKPGGRGNSSRPFTQRSSSPKRY